MYVPNFLEIILYWKKIIQFPIRLSIIAFFLKLQNNRLLARGNII